MVEVIEVGGSERCPPAVRRLVVTKEWTPLEPDVDRGEVVRPRASADRETQTAGGDGTLELVEYSPGSSALDSQVRFRSRCTIP